MNLLSFYRANQNTSVAKTPPITNGLTVWLDIFDSSTITLNGSNQATTVNDKSGNGNNFSNSGHYPAYDSTKFGGKGGLVFNYASTVGLYTTGGPLSTVYGNRL